MHADTSHEVRHRDDWVGIKGSEAGRGVGAAGETPTMGVVVESRADANSTSRLARWFCRSARWRGPWGSSAAAPSGTLRLAGARTNRRITTLLYLAVAGPGRVGFRVVLLDGAGSVLGTTPIRVLRPGASEVIDLAAAASLLGVAFPEGSVGLDWVAEGGTRLFGHATEALTRDVRGGQLKPRRNPSAGPVLLTEVGIEPVAPSVVKEFLGI